MRTRKKLTMTFDLSKRERQVLLCLWDGLSVKETATNLRISFCYAKNVFEHIRIKLGVANRVLIIRRALELGLLTITKEQS